MPTSASLLPDKASSIAPMASAAIDLDSDGEHRSTPELVDDETIDLISDGEELSHLSPEDVADEENELLELEEITSQEFAKNTIHLAPLEPPVDHYLVQTATLEDGSTLKAGHGLELECGEFLRIAHLFRHKFAKSYTLRGNLLRRQSANNMENMFRKNANELVLIVFAETGDSRRDFIRSLIDRPLALSSFFRIRQIIFTNAMFPEYTFREIPVQERAKYYNSDKTINHEYVAEHAEHFFCRYKSVKRRDPQTKDLVESMLARLSPDEADSAYSKSNEELYGKFRSPVFTQRVPISRKSMPLDSRKSRLLFTPEPSRRPSKLPHHSVARDSDKEVDDIIPKEVKRNKSSAPGFGPSPSQQPQTSAQEHWNAAQAVLNRYSIMDLFAGSGGVSEGGKLAGLDVEYAIDKELCCVHTHQKNHPDCVTIHGDVTDIIGQLALGQFRPDIVHFSCPCKYFSYAHTIPGKDDERNETAVFVVEEAGKKLRPRMMTFEQTPGICRIGKHKAHWQTFISQLTGAGYSVKWRILNLADYGNPQRRRRLIILASCPGQKLPDFPKATHGTGCGLVPYRTVNDAIAHIPQGTTWHDRASLRERQRHQPRHLPTADGNQPLSNLIDTSGPHALHPSGKRMFTIREVLRLQTFPDAYEYVCDSRTRAMRMAGDAVPPVAAKAWFEECKKALQETDAEFTTPIELD